ncbi:hypothetical protein FB451DRAFT_1370661, partial [Mycena latifolia]
LSRRYAPRRFPSLFVALSSTSSLPAKHKLPEFSPVLQSVALLAPRAPRAQDVHTPTTNLCDSRSFPGLVIKALSPSLSVLF